MRQVLAFALSIAILSAASASAQTTTGASQSGQQTAGTAPPPQSAAGQAAQPPAAPQSAQTSRPQTSADSRGIGQHVSSVAPEHPLLDGAHFGACVSEMAITGECPHEDM